MNRPLLSMLLIAVIISGCTQNSPMVPSKPVPNEALVSNYSESGHVLWGTWQIVIDSEKMTANVVPLRGAEFTCNVTKFMQPPSSPTNLVSIAIGPGSIPADGYFEVDVGLQHPFPGLKKFSGFDVRGILMTNGSMVGYHDSSVIIGSADNTRLMNPDGYTRWWNYSEFSSYNTIFGYTAGKLGPSKQLTATANPYKYFALGLPKDTPVTSLDPASRGFFPTDAGVLARTYKIQFAKNGSQTLFDFQYAIDASWAAPDPAFGPDFPVEAFPQEANCQEAYAVRVSDAGSSAYYIAPGNSGGELLLNVEVFDWQGKDNINGVQNEISGLWLEGGVLNGAVDVIPIATILPGTTDTSVIFQVTLSSLNLTTSGVEHLFGTVESAGPDTFKPQIPTGDNFAHPDAHLAAYFTCAVNILPTVPTDPAIVTDNCARWGKVGQTVLDVTIEGEKFDPACTVELEYQPGDTIQGQNLLWVNAGKLVVDFDLTGATVGKYDVRVINPGATAGVLADSFEVMDPNNMPIWPNIQGNSAMTGMAGLYGPCKMHNKYTWQSFFQENPYGNPLAVFLSKDTAYLSNTGDGGPLAACAVNLSDGSIKWNQMFHDDMQNWLNVKGLSADGSVVIASESGYNTIYGLDASDGSEIWEISGLIPVDSYVALDLDGNFIIPIDDVGYRSIVPSSGKTNWVAPIGDPYYCTPAVGSNGVIYCTEGDMYDAQLHALDPSNGFDNWSDNPHIGSFYNGVTVHPNGTVLVHGGDTLFCFADSGQSASIVWQQNYKITYYSSVAVGPSGDIYIIDGDGILRRISSDDGSTMQSSAGWGDGVESRPAIGADGLIYTYTRLYDENKAYFSCFNPDCSLKWQYEGGGWFTDGPFGQPAIGQDGKVYASYRKLGLVAWQD
jgi:hypothetical protein